MKLEDLKIFLECLKKNEKIIPYFCAEWCEPCKMIEKDIEEYFSNMPDNVQCALIDVDDSIDVYGFLRSKKIVKGIPALLGYKEDNTHYAPDEFISGTNKEDIKYFFDTCIEHAK